MANKAQLPHLTARMRSYKSSQAVVNARFYSILGGLVFAALCGIFAVVAWLTNTPPAPDLLSAQPKGKAVAELTASAVLVGRPLPVPLGGSVATSDQGIVVGNGTPLQAQDLVWGGFIPEVTAGIPFERHLFEFIVPNDPKNPRTGSVRYRMTVIVLVVDGEVPMLGAMPYIEAAPQPVTRTKFDYGASSGVSQVPDAVRNRLADWASFWAIDDRQRLQAITGDGRTDVEYLGLGGFTSAGVTVLAAVPQQEGPWLLRVRVALSGPNGFATEIDMDVTISNANQAAPLVVAWGPAGSGVLSSGTNSKKKA